jgi:ferrous iron transport protein B
MKGRSERTATTSAGPACGLPLAALARAPYPSGPQSGKTTLFNRLTGCGRVGISGVTVEEHLGYVKTAAGENIAIVDLPGVYSLAPRSEDARVAVDVLHGRMPGLPRPESVLLVLDATALERQLALAVQVIGLGLPTLVILNMADSAARAAADRWPWREN